MVSADLADAVRSEQAAAVAGKRPRRSAIGVLGKTVRFPGGGTSASAPVWASLIIRRRLRQCLTRPLLAGALACCSGRRDARHSCVERRGDERTSPGRRPIGLTRSFSSAAFSAGYAASADIARWSRCRRLWRRTTPSGRAGSARRWLARRAGLSPG
jgi:hypothetical protein